MGHASLDTPAEATAEPATGPGPRVDELRVAAYTLPTDGPESDGTLTWDTTTIVVVQVAAAGVRGLGYTYADPVAARLAADTLAPLVVGTDAFRTTAAARAMTGAVRNAGRPGIAATAISAVDIALFDLKARLLGCSLADLLGRCHDSVVAYGSGGFTSYPDWRLEAQLGGWADEGFGSVKMKVGRDPDADPARVAAARRAIGADVALFVDANGAHDRRSAARAAERFAHADVTWFEEPVSSDDRAGLRWLRDRVPARMAIAAGEYGWGPDELLALLRDDAVDVLQIDATRSLGVTGFVASAALAAAFHVPVSAHCAPSLHAQLMAATPNGIHQEWFHDHVRVEHLLFDGAPDAVAGRVSPDPSRHGLGLALRDTVAEPYLVWRS